MSNKYYNLDKDLKNKSFNFIMGGRNAGKTYFVEHNILNKGEIRVIRKEVNHEDNKL